MPHGHLTPLGRQLRSVLASISNPAHKRYNATRDNALRSRERHALRSTSDGAGHVRSFHHGPVTRASSATAAAYNPTVQAEESPKPSQDGRRFRSHSRNRLHRRKRVDHLTEALKDTANENTVPYTPEHQKHRDMSYINVQSRSALKDLRVRRKRHAHDPIHPAAESRELSLQRILASLIRHRARASDFLEADWNTPFELSPIEADFLRSKNVTLDDISAWADITTAEDSLDAAQSLARRAEKLGPASVPMFVYLNLLRRGSVSARALRIFVPLIANLCDHLAISGGDRQPIMIAVVRLLRHAREVWPQAMHSIVQILLRHYQHQRETMSTLDVDVVATATHFLNRAMSLVSISTAVHPLKHIPYQEEAILPILQYMSQHDPPLHINRVGYRAVARIQLPQRKTEKEQEWARLKALSWPPWKSDRTAMDSLITAEEHGVSKAAATLTRSREAGYRPLDWEKAAQLYAGWDIDGTPTIQMRALLKTSLWRRPTSQADDDQVWAARIQSTRTIQEAWACFLAWEDTKLPPDQGVFYAIMIKLQQEERRGRISEKHQVRPTEDVQWSLLPGDVPETWPLPPSTHLYTYTRTPPPSLQDFYDTMTARGITFEGHALAFLIHNAYNIHFAARVMLDSIAVYPAIESLLQYGRNYSIQGIPSPVLVAIMEFLARWASSRILTKFLPKDGYQTRLTSLWARACDPSIPDDAHYSLNPYSSMTVAIDILRTQSQSIPYRPAWNAVLKGLTHEPSLPSFGRYLIARLRPPQWIAAFDNLPAKERRFLGAIDAFALVPLVLHMAHERNIDLDATGLHYVCLATENMTISAWSVLETVLQAGTDGSLEKSMLSNHMVRDAELLIRGKEKHGNAVKRVFSNLVGEEQVGNAEHPGTAQRLYGPLSPGLPRLLAIPEPAVLHAYIRALGWLGDHEQLRTLVLWMRDHQQELAEGVMQDRKGPTKMRRAMIALRVFLERSWIPSESRTAPANQQMEDNPTTRASLVAGLRAPAEAELIADVQEVVNSVEEWQGWASDEEVGRYTADRSFSIWRGQGR